jgi:hypothetical protein
MYCVIRKKGSSRFDRSVPTKFQWRGYLELKKKSECKPIKSKWINHYECPCLSGWTQSAILTLQFRQHKLPLSRYWYTANILFFFAPVNMLKSQGTVHIIAAITTPEEIVLEKCWTEMLHVMCDGCFQWCFLNADSRTHILAHHLVSCMYLVLSTCKNLPGNQVGLLLWTCRKARPGYKYEMTDTFMNYIHEVYGNGQNISQQPTCSDPLHF